MTPEDIRIRDQGQTGADAGIAAAMALEMAMAHQSKSDPFLDASLSLMGLLPSEQRQAQLAALRLFVESNGNIVCRQPCDCGSQIRHNNGGNYHQIIKFRMDGGLFWRSTTFTGDYAPADDWRKVSLGDAIEEIADHAQGGWDVVSGI